MLRASGRGAHPEGERLLRVSAEASPPGSRCVVLALETTQTLAWGSSYYLPAILAEPMATEFAIPASWVFGAFSAALILSALVGPAVGRAIDARGGRGVLTASNLVLAAGLAGLGLAPGPVWIALAWLVLGLGMAMGTYDAAFATLAGLYGRAARGPISGVGGAAAGAPEAGDSRCVMGKLARLAHDAVTCPVPSRWRP